MVTTWLVTVTTNNDHWTYRYLDLVVQHPMQGELVTSHIIQVPKIMLRSSFSFSFSVSKSTLPSQKHASWARQDVVSSSAVKAHSVLVVLLATAWVAHRLRSR